MITKHEARSLIRKGVKRVPQGEEIRHLNIMPMMDIMTILLVAFIVTSAEAAAFSVGDVNLPGSKSIEPLPEQAVTLTIAREAILVDGKTVVQVRNHDVDASEVGPAKGRLRPRRGGHLREIADEERRRQRAFSRRGPGARLPVPAPPRSPLRSRRRRGAGRPCPGRS